MTQNRQTESNFKPLDYENRHANTIVSFSESSSLIKIDSFIKSVKFIMCQQGFGFTEVINRWKAEYKGLLPGRVNSWFTNGIDCEILQPGKNWKKGKIRFRLVLEFAPDEPEPSDPNSTLDDIRKMGDG